MADGSGSEAAEVNDGKAESPPDDYDEWDDWDLDRLGSPQDRWGLSVFDDSEFLPTARFIDRQLCLLAGEARLAQGLTQSELAAMLNTSQGAIARFESGKQRAPNWRLFREIVGRLGFMPDPPDPYPGHPSCGRGDRSHIADGG